MRLCHTRPQHTVRHLILERFSERLRWPTRDAEFRHFRARGGVGADARAKLVDTTGDADSAELAHTAFHAHPNPSRDHARAGNLLAVDRVTDLNETQRTRAEVDDRCE